MEKIKIEVVIDRDLDTVWKHWNTPESIKGWAFASDTWEVGEVTNDLRVGGKFSTNMRAKDGTESFDFSGIYDEVEEGKQIKYTMDGEDRRVCKVTFERIDENTTRVTEELDTEATNPVEMQRAGWLSILENFKKHVTNA